MENVNVNLVKSNDVDRLIYNTRGKLKKAQKPIIKSEADLEKLVKRNPFIRFISIITTIIIFITLIACGFFCVANIYARLNNRPLFIFGVGFMVIASGSMEDSGFEIGDIVAVRSVDVDTLEVGDIIGFYVDRSSYKGFSTSNSTLVDNKDIDLQYLVDKDNFFGTNNSDMKMASFKGCKLVFHHIAEIYEDQEGTRWFITKGSSNNSKDSWKIKETLILGAYDDADWCNSVSNTLKTISTVEGVILCIILPLVLILLVQLVDFFKFLVLAIIEYQLIVGIRKPTDKICSKYNMGMHLSNKDKYRVLSHATADEELEWCNLLWWDAEKLQKHKKFIMRKHVLTAYYKELTNLTKECADKVRSGESFSNVSRYYDKMKNEIERKQELRKKQLKQSNLSEENISNSTKDANTAENEQPSHKMIVEQQIEVVKQEQPVLTAEEMIDKYVIVDQAGNIVGLRDGAPEELRRAYKMLVDSKKTEAVKVEQSNLSYEEMIARYAIIDEYGKVIGLRDGAPKELRRAYESLLNKNTPVNLNNVENTDKDKKVVFIKVKSNLDNNTF